MLKKNIVKILIFIGVMIVSLLMIHSLGGNLMTMLKHHLGI